MIRIILSLIFAGIVTFLVSKLNYFKSASKKSLKSHGRRMIIWGVWVYFIFTLIFAFFRKEMFGLLAIGINIIPLVLILIGFIMCIVSKEKYISTKKVNKNKTDNITNILD